MEEQGAAVMGQPTATTDAATTQIVAFVSPDVAATIGRTGLLEERVGGDGTREMTRVVRERAVRSDVLAQILAGGAAPEDAPTLVAKSMRSTAGEDQTRLVVLSLHSDLFATDVFRHRTTGWLVAPPDDHRTSWAPETLHWLGSACQKTAALTTEQSAANLRSILTALHSDDRTVLIYNVSTYDPTNRTHRFAADKPDPYAVQANRLIAALEHLATEFDASVVDVDGGLAELGAAQHVRRPGGFSADAAEFITEDAILLIDQSGALDGSLQAPVMRLEVPPYDRRTTGGVLTKWHAAPGSTVAKGDLLFDIRFDGLAYKVEVGPDEDEQRAAKRVARRRTQSTQSLVLQVLAGSDGYVYEQAAPEGSRVSVGETAAIMTPAAPEGSVDTSNGAPAFRLGLKLKEH